jgi:hypothetical protein
MASRQAEWQKRRKAEGKCIICGKPLHNATYCLKHAIMKREEQRKRLGSKARHTGWESYKAEQEYGEENKLSGVCGEEESG